VKAIYEESRGAIDSVSVLKAEYSDPPVTPRYLVVLDAFHEPTIYTARRDTRDYEAIRWAQAEYDTLKAKVADQ
jgi:hypothetical protein